MDDFPKFLDSFFDIVAHNAPPFILVFVPI